MSYMGSSNLEKSDNNIQRESQIASKSESILKRASQADVQNEVQKSNSTMTQRKSESVSYNNSRVFNFKKIIRRFEQDLVEQANCPLGLTKLGHMRRKKMKNVEQKYLFTIWNRSNNMIKDLE